MKKRLMFAVALILILMTTAAYAQVKAGSVSLSPFIGGYVFEGNENIRRNNLAVGLRAGYNFTKNWGVEGFFNYVPTKMNDVIGDDDFKLYGYGAEALYHFMPDSRLVPFVAAGLGGTRYTPPQAFPSKHKFTVDYGAGLKYFLTDLVSLRADIRHVIPLNDYHHNLLYTLGVTFSFGGAKKAVAEGSAVQQAAAPAEIIKDSDKDGVPDNMDSCPGTPAGVAVDKSGCPLDSDKDGVYDYKDKCPGTPEGVQVDKDGCPLDSDGDGVYDYLDRCPDTKKGTPVDKDGCPKPVMKEVKREAAVVAKPAIIEKGKVTLNVQFDTNKAVIKKGFYDDIDGLAEVMKQYPDLKVEIDGHTDNVGAAAYNKKLSQARANAVVKYLVKKHGIDKSRLSARGFGLENPIASNKTKEGRAQNRRVEAVAEYIKK